MWRKRLWKLDGLPVRKKIDFEWWVWQLEKVGLARTFEHLWKSENLGKFKHLWISEHLKIFGDGRGSWGRSSWRVPSLPEVDCYALPCLRVRVCRRSFVTVWPLPSSSPMPSSTSGVWEVIHPYHHYVIIITAKPLQEVNALIYSVLPVLWHSGQSLITIAMFVPCLNMQLLPERVTVCLCLCIFVNMQLIPGRHSCCLIVFVFFLTRRWSQKYSLSVLVVV